MICSQRLIWCGCDEIEKIDEQKKLFEEGNLVGAYNLWVFSFTLLGVVRGC